MAKDISVKTVFCFFAVLLTRLHLTLIFSDSNLTQKVLFTSSTALRFCGICIFSCHIIGSHHEASDWTFWASWGVDGMKNLVNCSKLLNVRETIKCSSSWAQRRRIVIEHLMGTFRCSQSNWCGEGGLCHGSVELNRCQRWFRSPRSSSGCEAQLNSVFLGFTAERNLWAEKHQEFKPFPAEQWPFVTNETGKPPALQAHPSMRPS